MTNIINNQEKSNYGVIVMPRGIEEEPVFATANIWQMFSHFVFKAAYKEQILCYTSGKNRLIKIELKRGQLIVGRKKLAEKFSLTEQQIRTLLKKLADFGYIKIEGKTSCSIVTVLNYERFQLSKKQDFSNQKTTNKQPTFNQEITSEQPTRNQHLTTNGIKGLKENKGNKGRKTDRTWDFIFKDFDFEEKEAYAFHELFMKFCEFRANQRNSFKTEYYAKKQFSLLLAYSKRDFEIAKKIVNQTIEEQRITFSVLKEKKEDFEDNKKQINDLGNNSAETEFNEW